MPATFESFGVRFLYPENWTEIPRDDADGPAGVTFELPSGGFFAIEREAIDQLVEEIIEDIGDSFERDYGEVEREELKLESLSGVSRAVEFRFYYLDLVVLSRLIILERRGKRLVIQIQAESRDFDRNEPVFAAILTQLDQPEPEPQGN
jgi:hypothetical protein